jgi:hypothetical protein
MLHLAMHHLLVLTQHGIDRLCYQMSVRHQLILLEALIVGTHEVRTRLSRWKMTIRVTVVTTSSTLDVDNPIWVRLS